MAKFMKNFIGENTQDCKGSFQNNLKSTNKDKQEEHNTHDDLQHLGFNGGQGGVKITEDVIKELEESYKMIIIGTLLQMVSFGDTSFKKNKLKNTKHKIKNLSNGAKNN
jgi:virulence-associated protein VapD